MPLSEGRVGANCRNFCRLGALAAATCCRLGARDSGSRRPGSAGAVSSFATATHCRAGARDPASTSGPCSGGHSTARERTPCPAGLPGWPVVSASSDGVGVVPGSGAPVAVSQRAARLRPQRACTRHRRPVGVGHRGEPSRPRAARAVSDCRPGRPRFPAGRLPPPAPPAVRRASGPRRSPRAPCVPSPPSAPAPAGAAPPRPPRPPAPPHRSRPPCARPAVLPSCLPCSPPARRSSAPVRRRVLAPFSPRAARPRFQTSSTGGVSLPSFFSRPPHHDPSFFLPPRDDAAKPAKR